MKKYIKASHLYRYITASKADQQIFIDKFGQKDFDDFQKLKQRIKQKGYSTDLVYHAKNTSPEQMEDILDSVSDEVREQEIDIEGRPIPPDNGNYEVVAKTSEWTIYHPLDYIASIYCANGGRWCTAGGYDIPEGEVKVSQAKQYFNEYVSLGVKLYYCISNTNLEDNVAVAKYTDRDVIQYFNYEDDEIGVEDISHSLYELLDKLELLPPEFVIDDYGVLLGYNGDGGDVVIPNGVTRIGTSAFSGCKRLTSITIPNSVTGIGNTAFIGCSNLTRIIVPDSVTSIGYRTFLGCSSLTSISIPDSVTIIGWEAFSLCTALTVYTSNYLMIDYCKENGIPYKEI